jgi:mannose-1-phosphate guanylyltransferase
MHDVYAVVMAGGVGSRFWPMSRAGRPKQLLDLFGDGTMLRRTMQRLGLPWDRQLVVSGTILDAPLRKLLPELPAENLLLEPVGRNTAPAIGWAALVAKRRNPDAILAVLPADHRIQELEVYRDAVARAVQAAREGYVATIGITPTRPDPGFGYIEMAAPVMEGVFGVRRFAEKPDRATAEAYLQTGNYLWNAGMFMLSAKTAIDELQRYTPELMDGLRRLDVDDPDPGLIAEVYPNLPSISIDYAVAEKSQRLAVVPGHFSWSDVGAWDALFDFREGKSYQSGQVIEIDGSGNVVVADGGAVAMIGVSDLIVVHTPDATLVCRRDEAQRVREVVAALRTAGRTDLL